MANNMNSSQFSTKRIAIDKAYTVVVAVVAAAAFIIVFSLVASKALLDQRSYQSKVISKKEIARENLNANIAAADQLTISYEEFVKSPQNVIGGNPGGDGDKDGDNARIVLDALPSKYDFPALTTSLDKLFRTNGFIVTAIDGTDDEVNQSATASAVDPQPIEMPFEFEIGSGAEDGKKLLELLERSIRPFQVTKLNIESTKSQLDFKITAHTYFQPEKNLDVKTEIEK